MTESARPPTPKRFKPAIDVRSARFLPGKPAFITRKKSRGKFAVGIRYERKVHEHLALLALGVPGLQYIESPWIEFEDRSGQRYCQLDGLLIDTRAMAAIIYEVKYKHIANAWWQLTQLYEPVVRKLLPEYRPICLMEVVHWHDPQVSFPERYDLTSSPLKVPHANKVAVCIFNPKTHGRLQPHGHNEREGLRQASGAERIS